jgi:hypothetical protein
MCDNQVDINVMRTEKQIEAPGPNGHLVRSTSNAHKRQLLANSVALPAERSEAFLELLHDFRQSLRPVGFLEERVVENIAVSDWHRRRYWIVGMTKIAHATALQEQSCDDFTHNFSRERGATQTAMAMSNLVDNGRSLEFFRRSEAGYSREYRHARKELKELQADRFKYEQAILNEGGDSTDFECYVESEFPESSFSEKMSEQTEPNRTEADVEAVVLPVVEDVPKPAPETLEQNEMSQKNEMPTEPDVPFSGPSSDVPPGGVVRIKAISCPLPPPASPSEILRHNRLTSGFH